MYITINEVIGEKRSGLFYPISSGRKIAVDIMLRDNVQYCLKGYIKVQLKSSEEITLKKGVYTDKELNSLRGLDLKSQMLSSRNDVLRTNKLEKVMKMAISLEELDKSNNLEDGKLGNALFTYYVTAPEYSTCFEPKAPQYKKLKTGEIVSLTLKITDKKKIITL